MTSDPFREIADSELSKPSRSRFAMRYGLYYGVLAIVLTLAFYLSGNATAGAAKWLSTLLAIILIIVTQLQFRKAGGGYLSYGRSLGVAVLAMFFGSLIVALFTYLLYKFDPALLDETMLAAEERLVEQGRNEDEIEMSLKILSWIKTPFMLAVSSILNLVFSGLVIGAITAIFTSKKVPEALFDN
jgi:membrane-associated HD superfamily phosphohydrolase